MEIGVKVPGNMRLNESACDHGRHGHTFNGPGIKSLISERFGPY